MSDSLRILHVVPTYLPAWRYGGPIRSVHGLARAQAAAGDAAEVFTTDVDGADSLDVPLAQPVDVDGVTVWYHPCGRPRRLYRSPVLGRALDRRLPGFDVVHLHSVFLWPTLAAARVAQRARVPYFVSPRGMLVGSLIARRGSRRKRAWITLFERRNLAGAAGILVQSELERDELDALGLALAPVHVVPNGVELGEADSAVSDAAVPPWLDELTAKPYVLFLGRLSWKKGIDRLIEALPLVDDVDLVIAGNDDEDITPRLKRCAEDIAVADRVVFAGEVRGPAKWALLRRARAFCLPSTSENFGIAAVEAMAVGTPTIVSPDVGIASHEALRAGLLVSPTDPRSLASAIRATLVDDDRLRELRETAQAVVRQELSWESIAARTRTIYQQAVAAPHRSAVSPTPAPTG